MEKIMEKLENSGEQIIIEKIKNFCKDFEGGNIIKLGNGNFKVERTDAEGNSIAIYNFSADGELIDYKGLDNIFLDPADLMALQSNKIKYPVIPLVNKKHIKQQKAIG